MAICWKECQTYKYLLQSLTNLLVLEKHHSCCLLLQLCLICSNITECVLGLLAFKGLFKYQQSVYQFSVLLSKSPCFIVVCTLKSSDVQHGGLYCTEVLSSHLHLLNVISIKTVPKTQTQAPRLIFHVCNSSVIIGQEKTPEINYLPLGMKPQSERPLNEYSQLRALCHSFQLNYKQLVGGNSLFSLVTFSSYPEA